MKKLLLGLAFLPLFGCHDVVRDELTYRTEVNFMTQAAMQEAESLATLITMHCKCTLDSEGVLQFTTPECLSAAKKVVVVRSRVPWHKAMMLYNARLSEDRPSVDPPAVPSPTSLCP